MLRQRGSGGAGPGPDVSTVRVLMRTLPFRRKEDLHIRRNATFRKSPVRRLLGKLLGGGVVDGGLGIGDLFRLMRSGSNCSWPSMSCHTR